MDKIVRDHFKDRVELGEYVQKRELASLPVDVDGRVLELGCGARPSYSIDDIDFYGMDITPDMIRAFRENYPASTLIIGDAKFLPFRKNVFQVSVAHDLLHHLVGDTPSICEHNVRIVISELKNVLDSEGMFLIKDVLSENYLFTLVMYYVTFFCARFNIEIDFLDIHSKVITYFFTKEIIISLLEKKGFQVVEMMLLEWKMIGVRLGDRTEIHARLRGD